MKFLSLQCLTLETLESLDVYHISPHRDPGTNISIRMSNASQQNLPTGALKATVTVDMNEFAWAKKGDSIATDGIGSCLAIVFQTAEKTYMTHLGSEFPITPQFDQIFHDQTMWLIDQMMSHATAEGPLTKMGFVWARLNGKLQEVVEDIINKKSEEIGFRIQQAENCMGVIVDASGQMSAFGMHTRLVKTKTSEVNRIPSPTGTTFWGHSREVAALLNQTIPER